MIRRKTSWLCDQPGTGFLPESSCVSRTSEQAGGMIVDPSPSRTRQRRRLCDFSKRNKITRP